MADIQDVPLSGRCDKDFDGLRRVFEGSIATGENLGGSVAVLIDGEPVVDLRGGWRDRKKSAEWEEDTIACVYSSGKAVLSALVMREVSEGRLDYDRPVAEIWPAFGERGKERVTLAQALSHQAGVPGFAEEKDPAIWLDWEATCAAIASEEPMWEPGTASGYHPQTFGYIAGEVLRRSSGKTYGDHLRDLGLNVHCGLSADQVARTAQMVKPPKAPDLGEITPPKKAAFLAPWSAPSGVAREAWAAAEIPASNTHANARGLAEVMQAYATGEISGKAFAGTSAREAAWEERIHGDDLVLPYRISWGAGVMRETLGAFGGAPTAIGHYGFGGSCVMADPARELSFAFVPATMSPVLVGDPRAKALLAELYRAVD